MSNFPFSAAIMNPRALQRCSLTSLFYIHISLMTALQNMIDRIITFSSSNTDRGNSW